MSENPEKNVKPFEERVKEFAKSKTVDITDGGMSSFIHNSSEMFDFVLSMLEEENQSRFPIIGFKDGTIALLGGKNQKYEHATILSNLNRNPEDVLFSTSIEGFDSDAKPDEIYIEGNDRYGKNFKIGIKKGADMHGLPSIKQGGGEVNLNKVFGGIDGLSINVPHIYR